MWGCGKAYITRNIVDQLDHASINEAYKITPQDLAQYSKCEQTPTVKIVVNENRIGEYEINKDMKVVINPKEMMDEIKFYLKRGYELSRIREDDKSTKVLQITMQDMNIKQSYFIGHAFDGYLKMEVLIPETNFRKSYETMERTGTPPTAYRAPAYAIHKVTRQIIDDPEIQKYILCKDERAKSNLPSQTKSETKVKSSDSSEYAQKLRELKKLKDEGLLTDKEYEQKRKAIVDAM
jgi:hypothetical protein